MLNQRLRPAKGKKISSYAHYPIITYKVKNCIALDCVWRCNHAISHINKIFAGILTIYSL